ncbi:TIGR02217 family protein [uncultured Methylobacterium sp.]|uniref:phage distal tail protein, Rcc01695 family n=1 Tax=uncultured Methylobacterium sp. TaxID=157278 RepID=UPI0035C99128
MADDFHEVRFPLDVSLRGGGGPSRLTEIVTLASGREHRNSRWADSRRRYDAGLGIRTLDALHAVLSFFEERRGRLYGFRYRDRVDFRSGPPGRTPGPTDQVLGVGDGATAVFALAKTYGTGPAPYTRAIAKPVAGSVRVAVAGIERPGHLFACDPATGRVTFAGDAVPPAGAAVTAGFAFDVPVRFDTDDLVLNLEAFTAGEIPKVPLIEIVP